MRAYLPYLVTIYGPNLERSFIVEMYGDNPYERYPEPQDLMKEIRRVLTPHLPIGREIGEIILDPLSIQEGALYYDVLEWVRIE